jgi:hypothetical protein
VHLALASIDQVGDQGVEPLQRQPRAFLVEEAAPGLGDPLQVEQQR